MRAPWPAREALARAEKRSRAHPRRHPQGGERKKRALGGAETQRGHVPPEALAE